MLDVCPVCKQGKIQRIEKKTLFLKTTKLLCNMCNAEFRDKGRNGFELSISKSDKKSRFDGKVLSEEDWKSVLKHDKTIREVMIEEIRKGKIPTIDAKTTHLPIFLKNGEEAYLYEGSNFYETRAVRRYGGTSFRVMKGVRIYTGQGESQQEMRLIDSGDLLLTNKRLVFSGSKRTINIDLRKIINLTQFSDGLQINRENKQKPEIFSTDKPDIWCASLEAIIQRF